MKLRLATALTMAFLASLIAEAQEVIHLYPGPAPGTEDWTQEEREYFSPIFNNNVVTNVTRPTLTAYLPDESKATGTAVIIAPGGAFHALSIDSEGTEVAQWLSERGIAGFVLRYRLVPTGEDGVRELIAKMGDQEQIQKDMASVLPFAGADGLAAMRYVREHAGKFGVSPRRVGFMGFSAGGAVTTHVGFNYDEDSRPAFLAPIYGGGGEVEDSAPPADAPPLFVAAATNDPLGLAAASVSLYSKWLKANKPAELHMYALGGHGFGMKKQDLPSDTWIERFGDWLESLDLPGV